MAFPKGYVQKVNQCRYDTARSVYLDFIRKGSQGVGRLADFFDALLVPHFAGKPPFLLHFPGRRFSTRGSPSAGPPDPTARGAIGQLLWLLA